MTGIDPSLCIMFGAALLAGFIDSIVGGGGLIQLPALMSCYPAMPPASVLGTNKLAAITGTMTAMIIYLRKVSLPKLMVAISALIALAAAAIGAAIATKVDPALLRPVIIVAVLLIGLYVSLRPGFGKESGARKNLEDRDRPPDTATSANLQNILHRTHPLKLLLVAIFTAGIGIYDGVFGPGTGMFLIIGYTAILGVSFLEASAWAKAVNVGTNLGALAMFAVAGHVYWKLALVMAVGNITGATLGSHLVLRKGTGLIRAGLLIIVVVLTFRLGWQHYGWG